MKKLFLLFLPVVFCIPIYGQAIIKRDTAQVIIIKNFEIPQLNRHRTIRIFLPAGYEVSKLKYPVIYMQDGQQLFNPAKTGNDSWNIDQYLKQQPTKKQCMVVAIDNSEKYRMSEYTPYDNYYAKQTGTTYIKFIVETLKPYIDKNYRTKNDPRHTAIAGSSMGGMISMYAALKYPGIFGNAGIFSPAFWMSPQIYNTPDSVIMNKKSRFYFVCGDEEGPETGIINKMDSILRSKGLSEKQTPVTIAKGKHNEQQWSEDFPAFYAWLIEKF